MTFKSRPMPLAIGLRNVNCILENVGMSVREQLLLEQEEVLLIRCGNDVKILEDKSLF